MPNLLEERERGYEAKWAHDDQMKFAIMARRNALLGQWAAEEMQLPATEISLYVETVINAGLTGKGRNPVFDKIRHDFDSRMLACPDAVIRTKMQDLLEQAVEYHSGRADAEK